MNKLFLLLSFLMGFVVLSSNYLVQFPIKHYGLEEILTYGAFSYPIAFLITDLANRSYGKLIAKKIVYIGFTIGISFTLLFSTNFTDLISVRIAIGSGTAFIVAQLLDVQIFDQLRKKKWFIAPLTSCPRCLYFTHLSLCVPKLGSSSISSSVFLRRIKACEANCTIRSDNEKIDSSSTTFSARRLFTIPCLLL